MANSDFSHVAKMANSNFCDMAKMAKRTFAIWLKLLKWLKWLRCKKNFLYSGAWSGGSGAWRLGWTPRGSEDRLYGALTVQAHSDESFQIFE